MEQCNASFTSAITSFPKKNMFIMRITHVHFLFFSFHSHTIHIQAQPPKDFQTEGHSLMTTVVVVVVMMMTVIKTILPFHVPSTWGKTIECVGETRVFLFYVGEAN